MTLSDVDLRTIWVRAGGRCVLCKKYLLEGEITWRTFPLGEGAHIVGRKDSARSPRGVDPLPPTERDTPENVLLACSGCHSEIDVMCNTDVVDKQFLLRMKQQHEQEIRRLTGMITTSKTAVIRMVADIRGDRTSLATSEAVLAVIRHGRVPHFLGAYDTASEEIDLRGLTGEAEAGATYYRQATDKIDDVIDRRIAEGIARGDVEHLSVFALARVPLLVYLGSRIDDAVTVDVFQRHRQSESWVWPDIDPGTTFDVECVRAGESDKDVAVIMNLSGTTPIAELPEALGQASVFTLSPASNPGEDVIAHPEVLARFAASVREFFTALEATHKAVETVHVFGALPLAAAVALGRILKSRGVRPNIATYDRTHIGYVEALVI